MSASFAQVMAAAAERRSAPGQTVFPGSGFDDARCLPLMQGSDCMGQFMSRELLEGTQRFLESAKGKLQ